MICHKFRSSEAKVDNVKNLFANRFKKGNGKIQSSFAVRKNGEK